MLETPVTTPQPRRSSKLMTVATGVYYAFALYGAVNVVSVCATGHIVNLGAFSMAGAPQAAPLQRAPAAAFAESRFTVPSRASAPRMSVMDTLPGLQGPEIFWGSEGPPQGHEESEIKGYEGFGKFAAALESTGVAKSLAGSGPFTVLAPTDAAIDEFTANGGKITADVLKYHILPAKITTAGFSSADLKTTQGSSLQYKRFARKDFLDGVGIGVKSAGPSKGQNYPADVDAGNGVIHTINGVLAPGAYHDNTGDEYSRPQ